MNKIQYINWTNSTCEVKQILIRKNFLLNLFQILTVLNARLVQDGRFRISLNVGFLVVRSINFNNVQNCFRLHFWKVEFAVDTSVPLRVDARKYFSYCLFDYYTDETVMLPQVSI